LFYVEVFVINSYVVTLLESFQQSEKTLKVHMISEKAVKKEK